MTWKEAFSWLFTARKFEPPVMKPAPLYYMSPMDLDEFDTLHNGPGWYVRWRVAKNTVMVYGPWEDKVEMLGFLQKLKDKYRGNM